VLSKAKLSDPRTLFAADVTMMSLLSVRSPRWKIWAAWDTPRNVLAIMGLLLKAFLTCSKQTNKQTKLKRTNLFSVLHEK
jgi:hypothetical protein